MNMNGSFDSSSAISGTAEPGISRAAVLRCCRMALPKTNDSLVQFDPGLAGGAAVQHGEDAFDELRDRPLLRDKTIGPGGLKRRGGLYVRAPSDRQGRRMERRMRWCAV